MATKDPQERRIGWANHTDGPPAEKPISEILWSEQRVAVHWGDYPSTDPDLYREKLDDRPTSAKKDLIGFNKHINKNALVGARYPSVSNRKILVGFAETDRADLLIFDGYDMVDVVPIDCYDTLEDEELSYDPESENITILKSFELSEVRVAEEVEHPDLFKISKQPRGTMRGTDSLAETLLRVVSDEPVAVSVDSLTETQTEILCSEFLRLITDDFRGIVKPGRDRDTIDILAKCEGDITIYAQVSQGNTHTVDNKIKKLATDSDPDSRDRTIMFGYKDSRPSSIPDGIDYIDLEQVFLLCQMNTRTRNLIEDMIPLTPE